MKKIHIALSTHDLEHSVKDYTQRLGISPCVHLPDTYALWRTEAVNLSVRKDTSCQPGTLRHLGFEDPDAKAFTCNTDINGITWEHFNLKQQLEEIEHTWPQFDRPL